MSLMRKALLVIGVLIAVVVGFIVYGIYPRHVSIALKGIEYRLGNSHNTKSITLELNGTLHTSLLGKQSFDGTVNIFGTTIPNQDNGKSLIIALTGSATGGEILYFNWETMQYYDYGSMYTNRSFNQFTILEYQQDGTKWYWNGGNGLMVSTPAQTRTQARQISNELMRNHLKGRILK